MNKSKLAVTVNANINHPKTKLDLWWLAVGVFISRINIGKYA